MLAERGDVGGRSGTSDGQLPGGVGQLTHTHAANATQVRRESSTTAPAESVNPDVEGGENSRAPEGRRSGALFTLLLRYFVFPPFFSSCSSKPEI